NYLGFDAAKPGGQGKYEGRFGQRQVDFIANVLNKFPPDKLVVACMHIPLQTYLDSANPEMNTSDRSDFLKLLAGRPHTVSLSGHTHTTEHHYFSVESGFSGPSPHHHHVMTTVSGSWWSGPYDHRGIAVADSRDGSPNGFHVLSIDGQNYSTRFQPAKEPNSRKMRIVLDSEFHRDRKELYNEYRMGELLSSPLSQERVFATNLIVNFFDGAEHICRISHGQTGADQNGARDPLGPLCRGGVCPQRGDEEALGESPALIAYLVGAIAGRPPTGHPLRCSACNRRIWPGASRQFGPGSDRRRQSAEGLRWLRHAKSMNQLR